MKKKIFGCLAALAIAMPTVAQAALISEFEPNPAGGDPTDTTVELSSGTPLAAFDYWLLSIESDPGGSLGFVDRAANVTGNYDANGLAVVTMPDLENPSLTLVLTDAFTGSVGDDLDVGDTGTLDVSSLGAILDAVGVSDTAGDDALVYGSSLGGTDILFNGQFEPLNVFRDASVGDFYQSVTVDFGTPDQRVAVFGFAGEAGGEIAVDLFDQDPTATTFGAFNPSLAAVPEPSSLLALVALGMARAFRRRKSV